MVVVYFLIICGENEDLLMKSGKLLFYDADLADEGDFFGCGGG